VHPFVGMDVASLLRDRARTFASRPFLIWEPFDGPPRMWTYGAFYDEVSRVAGNLSARGIGMGDRVMIHLDNCPEFLLSWFACALLGAVAVTSNTRLSKVELAYLADHADVQAAITQPCYTDRVVGAAPFLEWIAVTATDAGSDPAPTTAPDKSTSFASLLTAADYSPRRSDPARIVSVQYTSGTTSRPKGVAWSHANALWGAKVSGAHEDLRSDDVHLVVLPLFHTNALSYSVLPTLWTGGAFVLQPKFSASRFWDVATRNHCTVTSITLFVGRVLSQRDVPPNDLRLIGYAVCDPPLSRHLGVKIIGWWGMTETVSHGIVGAVHSQNSPLTIGRAATEYDLRIVANDGTPAALNDVGELLIRGSRGVSMFSRYLHDEAATTASFDDAGWFHTGDLVRLDEEGSIRFCDRAKDMLKVGGENVAASEIERVVLQVSGVSEAAVVGQADPLFGEIPVAVVVPVDGPTGDLTERISAACKEQLADFKQPRAVHLVRDLPRATLEKVAKAELRRRLNEGSPLEPSGAGE
jgi:crotonobetaine/carnitine-CoA ligase